MILAGCTRAMDVGLRGEHRFLLGAGAGLDGAITAAVKKVRGRHSSVYRWVLPVIRTALTYTYPKIRVAVDGTLLTESGDYAIVGNCRYSAGVFPATPRARIDDGRLDVCVLHGLTPWRLIVLALTAWRGRFVERPFVKYAKGTQIDLEAADADCPIPMQIDGDPAPPTPAHITVLPRALRMVVPQSMLAEE